ncbi:hypothetical protein ALC62_10454 [Cyphomyrmex costatus]|uniref:Uncharacterized protein n=1 Tax=Cyphomyrmex costatus TaxID=456900 RepID=A0A151IDU0_9HYME|nr:hypothetical protein ALC62_10454 [Cyphomyrmex costatus]
MLEQQSNKIVKETKQIKELKDEIRYEIEKWKKEQHQEMEKWRREQKQEIDKWKIEQKKITDKIEKENDELRMKIVTVEKKLEDQERKERRANLVIKGETSNGRLARQVTEEVLKKLDVERRVKVKDAFKMGRENEIFIVKMDNLEDKRIVMENRRILKGTSVYIDDDLSKNERERQRKLRMWANGERMKGMNPRVKYGRVFMNGKEYVLDECGENVNERVFGGRVYWNVAGVKNKKEDFWKYILKFDVIGLTETWLEEKDWEGYQKKATKGVEVEISKGKKREEERKSDGRNNHGSER